MPKAEWVHRRFKRLCATCKQEFVKPIGDPDWDCPICAEIDKKEREKRRAEYLKTNVETYATIQSIEAISEGDDVRILVKVGRPSERVEFMPYAFSINFRKGMEASEIYRHLWVLSQDVKARCIDDVKYSYKCPNCGAVFFNYTKRRKKYCTPLCQNTAGVRRARKKKKLLEISAQGDQSSQI